MNTMTSPLSYPPRPDNVQLRDLHRGSTVLTVDDMERWYQRLQDAIDSGYCWDVCSYLEFGVLTKKDYIESKKKIL